MNSLAWFAVISGAVLILGIGALALRPPWAPSPGNQVAIVNYAFSPSTLTVSTGTTVRWVNMDGDAHTVTFDDRGHDMAGMDSGRMGHMGTLSFMFAQPGTYEYRCSLHPSMIGRINVTPYGRVLGMRPGTPRSPLPLHPIGPATLAGGAMVWYTPDGIPGRCS